LAIAEAPCPEGGQVTTDEKWAEGSKTPQRASPADNLAFTADWKSIGKYVPPSAVSKHLRDAVYVAAGLNVNVARLRRPPALLEPREDGPMTLTPRDIEDRF